MVLETIFELLYGMGPVAPYIFESCMLCSHAFNEGSLAVKTVDHVRLLQRTDRAKTLYIIGKQYCYQNV
jgi:hypothetical protein